VDAVALVRSTMIAATVAWAAGEALMRRSLAADRLARALWTAAIALAFVHVALAFHLVYGWDHDAAVAATAQQAADRFGWGWRGAIYVNYVFLALWLADVCWWWAAPASHASRAFQVEAARVALFAFMFINGAVIFASGLGRLVGIAAVAVALAAPIARPRRVVSA
jgi:hypothetical protein